ncbi:MAG: hypothetical protein AB7O45_13920 [Alphaproteobacteria bacterium]
MFSLFTDSHGRLFKKELKDRGVKLDKAATKAVIELAVSTIPPGQHGLPSDLGQNQADQTVIHFAWWTAELLLRAAGKPSRRSHLDPDLYPETEAALRAVLVKNGALKA